MEENVVKSTCGVARLEINIRKDEKSFSQNLTRWKVLDAKADFFDQTLLQSHVFRKSTKNSKIVLFTG